MPLVTPTYSPPFILRQGDVYTVAAYLYGSKVPPTPDQTTLSVEDDDYLELFINQNQHSRATVIISHGLEGTAQSPYVVDAARAFLENGYSVVRWNMRGCGGVGNYQLPWYHSGDTKDLAAVVDWVSSQSTLTAGGIYLIGFSIGGNITLNYLSEGRDIPIKAAANVSVPVDLAGSAQTLAAPRNRMYMRYLLSPLKERIKSKHQLFPDRVDISGLDEMTTFAEFDEKFTAPIHGFSSAHVYWNSQSSLHRLSAIKVRSLLISALDDPFLSSSCFPKDSSILGDSVFAEYPRHGGHVGFLTGLRQDHRWVSKRLVQFFDEQ